MYKDIKVRKEYQKNYQKSYYLKHKQEYLQRNKAQLISYYRKKKNNVNKRFGLSMEQYDKITSKCVVCGRTEDIDCHHIIPKSKGGTNDINNYTGLCYEHHIIGIHRKHKTIEQMQREFFE